MPAQESLLEKLNSASVFKYDETPCANLSETQLGEATALACRLGASAHYIIPRLREYETLVTYRLNGRLIAFQLLQRFQLEEAVYVYHGPAFSRNAAFLPMFLQYFSNLLAQHAGKSMVLLSEIQNPNMLMLLHGLFGNYGFSFLNKPIPDAIQLAIPLFCRQFKHITNYNAATFTTSSTYSLAREPISCQRLISYLAAHQISFLKGDNMLFSSIIPAAYPDRLPVLERVQQGVETVSRWGEFKRSFFNSL